MQAAAPSNSTTFWELLSECVSSNSPLKKLTDVIEKPKVSTNDKFQLLDKLDKFENSISVHELFQKDEIIDDISTSSIKYLLLPYMKAQCLESVNDMQARHGALLTAKFNYSLFVHEACWYARERMKFLSAQQEFEIFSSLDYEKPDSSKLSAEDRRGKVIARRQMIKSLEETWMEHLSEAYKGDDSAEVFDFWVEVIYGAVLDSITCVDLINQELPLIARFRMEKEETSAPPNKSNEHEMRLDGTGKVLSKPFIMKISNSAELRKFYASRVLKPGHILPTISIAEAGLYDMRLEVDGLQAAQKKTVKEYKEGSTSEDNSDNETDPAAEEAKELKARKWDDWKDAHPKGSGNTMVNRG